MICTDKLRLLQYYVPAGDGIHHAQTDLILSDRLQYLVPLGSGDHLEADYVHLDVED